MDDSFLNLLGSQKMTDFLLNFLVIQVLVSMLYIAVAPNTSLLP